MSKKVAPTYFADSIIRPADEEKNLNELFRRFFNCGDGEKVLDYLSSLTVEYVQGPEYKPDLLPHLEGQRYLYTVIKTRIQHGKLHLPRTGDEENG